PDGVVLARLSTRTLLLKIWKPAYYIFDDGTLFVYRSFNDYYRAPRGGSIKKLIRIKDSHVLTPLKHKV
ncbi:unnamed protein product, partial [Phaeothamnion confervicola]